MNALVPAPRPAVPQLQARQEARVVLGFCTYRRAARLSALVQALRAQRCDEPFSILVVDNNSPDDAQAVLARLAAEPGAPLRFVTESEQGIVPARNRLLAEAAGAEFLLMLDDDELPEPGWLQQGLAALRDEGLDCVGGRVRVQFEAHERPSWLGPELLGFLAEVDYGDAAFAIRDAATPVWTANVGYRMSLFADGLRYDRRYSRVGAAVGGGEDVIMFETLLQRGCRIGYRPTMVTQHFVEPWRLKRSYFLRVHYASGLRAGLYATPDSPRRLFGAPLYLYPQALRQALRTLVSMLGMQPWVRQGMNFTNACGRIVGARRRAADRQGR